ncbi:hypothetical protein [Aliiglaciecola lipolytica]|uniref:Uncharacterized protein n=1 Tax=Aliiglaciecola lipolytica E3 TaxID=1127673 RepID=K6Y6K3_9ALTE|nr:hypothetical protein [Aliiglaciecola lipolytica]GAC13832.1 hypothetical protein GLIP_1191 [Aliiglaciecola lipolytica E3]
MQFTKEQVNQQQIGIKYCQGKLDKIEMEAFELFLLDNPDYLNELETDKLYSDFLDEAFEQTVITQNKQKAPRSVFQILFAAGAGALASFIFFTLTTNNHQSVVAQQVFMLDNMRSAPQIERQLYIDGETENVLLMFSVSPKQVGLLDVNIIEESNDDLVFKGTGISQTEMGDIAIVLGEESLSDGVYKVNVLDQSGEEVTFKFKVIRGD